VGALTEALEQTFEKFLDRKLSREGMVEFASDVGVSVHSELRSYYQDDLTKLDTSSDDEVYWALRTSDAFRTLWKEYAAGAYRQDEPALRVLALAKTFHQLASSMSETPQGGNELRLGDELGWNPLELERWACSGAATSGSKAAAQFVLGVWNRHEYRCGKFDLHAAMGIWDDEHRAAFLAWAKKPWWV
jgi:hypothetical protein